jgi:hypothetical protein
VTSASRAAGELQRFSTAAPALYGPDFIEVESTPFDEE